MPCHQQSRHKHRDAYYEYRNVPHTEKISLIRLFASGLRVDLLLQYSIEHSERCTKKI